MWIAFFFLNPFCVVCFKLVLGSRTVLYWQNDLSLKGWGEQDLMLQLCLHSVSWELSAVGNWSLGKKVTNQDNVNLEGKIGRKGNLYQKRTKHYKREVQYCKSRGLSWQDSFLNKKDKVLFSPKRLFSPNTCPRQVYLCLNRPNKYLKALQARQG